MKRYPLNGNLVLNGKFFWERERCLKLCHVYFISETKFWRTKKGSQFHLNATQSKKFAYSSVYIKVTLKYNNIFFSDYSTVRCRTQVYCVVLSILLLFPVLFLSKGLKILWWWLMKRDFKTSCTFNNHFCSIPDANERT